LTTCGETIKVHVQLFMTTSDITHILEIERACFPAPWRFQSFMAEQDNPFSLCAVIKAHEDLENSRVYAYSCCHVLAGEMTLLRLGVAPEKRGMGLGTRLLGVMLDESARKGAATAYLEVRPSNEQAQALYRKFGFRVVGTRPNYYPETGENALVMMKSLKETS
jgi:ribosomal-protein-alanine N-acetyltransferase